MPNYVKNPTWADGSGGGTPITAAKLNNMESGIFDGHYQAACRVTHNANQSINNTTVTTLAFNTEAFDTESNASSTIHDTASNNSRLTCRTAGKYLINACVEWAPNATGVRYQLFLLNGATTIAEVACPGNATFSSLSLTTIYDLAVNDYVELQVYQSSGGALNATTNSPAAPSFQIARIA